MNNHRIKPEWIPAAYRADKVDIDEEKMTAGNTPQIVKSTGVYPTKKALKQKMRKR